ncbi:MAG: hypothetical protein P4M08_05545 [Oligoflexia bacterium]|nr:hypothetical protein [Oligoflexia bacterium]
METSKIWKLCHVQKRYELGGLVTGEVIGFLAAVPEKDRSQWFAWSQGMSSWVSATDCPELAVTPEAVPWAFGAMVVSASEVSSAPLPPFPLPPLSVAS